MTISSPAPARTQENSARPHTTMRNLARLINPLVVRFAGTRLMPLYGVIEHVGRRSGKHFHTPVVVRATPDGFTVPMPYGEATDWYRNICAASGCVIRWKGRDYQVSDPQLVDKPAQNAPEFGSMRAMLSRVGIDHAVRLRRV